MTADVEYTKKRIWKKLTWRDAVSKADLNYGMFLFLAGSICGWMIEFIYRSLNHGEFYIPGFLFGPYCPIYGCGALLIHYVCYHKNLIVVFLRTMVVTSVLEYAVSVFFEAAFDEVLWNYSHLPFSIGNRVNLMFILVWGGLGVIAVLFGRRPIRQLYEKHEMWLLQSVRLWMVVLLLDTVASVACVV